ncbi:MAG: CRISPR-associated helicase Cas3' [Chloroflexota bacterium]|nr:CRISPR-associated helicase Cas3' [Chloroflexota bacterium]MDE2959652.1 CRISPR-associated helicase Cas3' [Chloroflexota bacterium]
MHRPYTTRFWGKSDRSAPERIHLLEHHLADVGACFEALVQQPLIRRRLAHTAGWNDIDDITAARLCVFAALHDVGKVNIGFQAQIWRPDEWSAGQRPPGRAGHTLDLTPVLNGDDRATSSWFYDALGWWWDATEMWDDCGGETVCGLLVATLSHHGTPLQLDSGRAEHPQLWRRYGELDPQEQVYRIGRLVREWFPEAFNEGGRPLPSAPQFQHHFLGLCNLADWIGSNELWFDYVGEPRDGYIDASRSIAGQAVKRVGLDISEQRTTVARSRVPDLTGLFPHIAQPNAIQRAAHDAPIGERLVIIESETGSGKTEAALWRFAKLYEAGLVDGLYFALPTRAAAKQIFDRVNAFVGNMFPPEARPEPVLAVPGYIRSGDAQGQRLQDYEVWWDDHAVDGRRWVAESPKRFLAAQIAVGTVDQAMLGSLTVKNAHMRASSLARNLLVVDEVHASDAYMSEVLAAVLDAHLGAGGYALLMSATLGAIARHRWLGRPADAVPTLADAIDAPYPAVSTASAMIDAGENDRRKDVSIGAEPEMRDFNAVAARALEAAQSGAKVLVVRNTVDYAIRTLEALLETAGPEDADLLFSVDCIPTLHHGRFAAVDRELLDAEIERRLGRGRPDGGLVVVGTQTLEQSLDIDADLLITDLCPADVLLQRIGRLHRHRQNDATRPGGFDQARCVVLTPGDDLSSLLSAGQNANGLGPHGGVYRNLHVLEATRRLIVEHPRWRIPDMNRELVERATHTQALDAITAELGDAWKDHAISTEGGHIADVQTARGHTIRRDRSFFTDNREVCFPSDEERIRTRLGDDRVDVTFDPPPASPFDRSLSIDRLAMPAWWLPGVEPSEPVQPTPSDTDEFEFRVGDRRFRYDRLGLRRLQ